MQVKLLHGAVQQRPLHHDNPGVKEGVSTTNLRKR